MAGAFSCGFSLCKRELGRLKKEEEAVRQALCSSGFGERLAPPPVREAAVSWGPAAGIGAAGLLGQFSGAGAASICSSPFCNFMRTSACLARSLECVAIITHLFIWWAHSFRIFVISKAVSSSRFPVGSSARMTLASEASARATPQFLNMPGRWPPAAAARRTASGHFAWILLL